MWDFVPANFHSSLRVDFELAFYVSRWSILVNFTHANEEKIYWTSISIELLTRNMPKHGWASAALRTPPHTYIPHRSTPSQLHWQHVSNKLALWLPKILARYTSVSTENIILTIVRIWSTTSFQGQLVCKNTGLARALQQGLPQLQQAWSTRTSAIPVDIFVA
jgi:hypothetical protein